MRIENSGEDKQGKVGNKEMNRDRLRVGPGVKKGVNRGVNNIIHFSTLC
jgi:hypothetical protein